MKNKLLAIALIVAISMTMFGMAVPMATTTFIDVDDYCWIEGVFHNDTYNLYPYLQSSIDIGFSKYGEMIGYNEDTGIGLGIQYPGYGETGSYDQDVLTEISVDPFASEMIDVDVWMNGWFIDMKYKKAPGDWREIWAFALFSDGSLHGGDWIELVPTWEVDWDDPARPLWMEFEPYANPQSDRYTAPKPPYGGRKTNGHCTTYPIDIVYNGPRKFVAVTQTRIMDGTTKLVDVFITIVFNKANKNVILLKDVKRLYDKGPLNIQFGNRGEWDLSPPAYVHFYTDHPVQAWDLDGDGDINETESDVSFDFFRKYMVEEKQPKKWWDEVPTDEIPTVDGEELPDTWFETQYTCYGREWHTDKTIKEHSYAVAQVIDSDALWVGALAVWPHPEFWSVQNSWPNPGHIPSEIPLMLRPLSRMLDWYKWTVEQDPTQLTTNLIEDRNNVWIKMDDMQSEPSIPFIIYEHDFELELGVNDIWRTVSVYVLTDWHDADDVNAAAETWSNGANIIDREIQYNLHEIFDPWDIYSDMHKWTKRWVHFFEGDDLTSCFDLPSTKEIELGEEIPCLPVYPYFSLGDGSYGVFVDEYDSYEDLRWDDYCTFPERVLVDGVLIVRDGYQDLDPIPGLLQPYYTINFITGQICFFEWDGDPWLIPDGSIVKVLWSSFHTKTVAEQWLGDGETKNFPLHHDIDDLLKYYLPFWNGVEVFVVDNEADRLFDVAMTDGTPWYAFTPSRTLTVYNVTEEDKEIEVKYYSYDVGSWHHEKFLSDGSETQAFTLSADAAYIKKVWIHKEKSITGGDYVVCGDNKTIYLQDPLMEGHWLLATYNSSDVYYEDWFYGEGDHAWDRNTFTLRYEPDVGTLVLHNTEIWQNITLKGTWGAWPYGTLADGTHGIWTGSPPPGMKCPVPDPTYAGLPDYKPAHWVPWLTRDGWDHDYQEAEWIKIIDNKTRGNWIIRETEYCDELVLDQPLENLTQILKIVYEVYSGRWEWSTVGMTAASVDSLGLGMVMSAFKNKGIEMGIGGLDIQDTAFGPRIPWLINEEVSPDSLGRNHLYDDWCFERTGDPWAMSHSWPISTSNIITVGGNAVNELAVYSNDWIQAIVTDTPEIYGVTCWDRNTYVGGDVEGTYGYAIISTYKDKNGTVVLLIAGWTGQDTYYATKWFEENKYWLQHINPHVTDLVLKIQYRYLVSGDLMCPPEVWIVEKLGTISEKPQHDP
jgi:hypothetical protein